MRCEASPFVRSGLPVPICDVNRGRGEGVAQGRGFIRVRSLRDQVRTVIGPEHWYEMNKTSYEVTGRKHVFSDE